MALAAVPGDGGLSVFCTPECRAELAEARPATDGEASPSTEGPAKWRPGSETGFDGQR